jgi:hypothetical protein
MYSPSPEQLLRGVADQLEKQVLPEVERAAAQRQLKASLHILRRLEHCWDRMPAYLAADAQDMLHTLTRLDSDDPDLRRRLADATARQADIDAAGWQAPTRDLVALHQDLQGCVTDADRRLRERADGSDEASRGLLNDLYQRMLSRESHAWGTDDDDAR